MERQYQPQPITVPRRLKASSGRQLKQIVDNRPEFAAQAKILGSLGVVQRWCPITVRHQQTGGNCGLFCIRMAIETLAAAGKPTLAPADYDAAAEANGSHVGEIFDIPTMEKIIKALGYSVKIDSFSDAVGLQKQLGTTSTHPTLIGFANNMYLKARGQKDGNLTKIAGQRGHWSLVHSIDSTTHGLGIINPNAPSTTETISIRDMNDASQAINPSKGEKFNWATFVKGIAGTGTTKATKGVDTSKEYTSKINGVDVEVTDNKASPTKIITGGEQKIDIGGSLVTIKP